MLQWGLSTLLHTTQKCTSVISTVLWLYTIQAIVGQHNHLSMDNEGCIPLEKFTSITNSKLPTNFHTWGCPIYILDAVNQYGVIGTPKWEPRLHISIYLRYSPCHTDSVTLLLNLNSGMDSPQFHVMYNNEFMTIPYLTSDTPPPTWTNLLKHSFECSTDDQEEFSYQWLQPHNIDYTTKASKGTTQPPPADPLTEMGYTSLKLSVNDKSTPRIQVDHS